MERRTADDICKAAIKNGMVTMLESGIEKVREGVTTLEEVIRMTRFA